MLNWARELKKHWTEGKAFRYFNFFKKIKNPLFLCVSSLRVHSSWPSVFQSLHFICAMSTFLTSSPWQSSMIFFLSECRLNSETVTGSYDKSSFCSCRRPNSEWAASTDLASRKNLKGSWFCQAKDKSCDSIPLGWPTEPPQDSKCIMLNKDNVIISSEFCNTSQGISFPISVQKICQDLQSHVSHAGLGAKNLFNSEPILASVLANAHESELQFILRDKFRETLRQKFSPPLFALPLLTATAKEQNEEKIWGEDFLFYTPLKNTKTNKRKHWSKDFFFTWIKREREREGKAKYCIPLAMPLWQQLKRKLENGCSFHLWSTQCL